MENQHRMISGYRELTADEIDLMNHIKDCAMFVQTVVERVRVAPAIDGRWASIAQTQLQQGFMALVRAVARPEGF